MKENNSWINNPSLNGIDPQKLMMLMQMSNQAGGKSINDLLPFLLASSSGMKKKGMSFSPDEFQLIFEALKQGKSKEEIDKMDRLVQMVQMMNRTT